MMQIKRFPVATSSIVILNATIFAIGLLSGFQTQIIQNYGFIPNHLFYVNNGNDIDSTQQDPISSLLQSSELRSPSLSESLTRLFTSMFIHANIAHIAFNLFALAYLGGYAERAIGVPRYLLVYLTSGIIAALFHGAIASYILHNGDVVLIGASGAISGVLGIAAAAGNSRAYYWLVIQIVFAVVGSVSALPIAFTAHVGGFIAGVLMTKVLVKLEQTKRKSRYFLQP
ncbi:MAG: rhomboid family intramembrane serine protease [Nitrososphaeraceae archaeon]|jgi:rhomboid protease GluP|nr:rhomboid family intramembrane serine protease [Nitrososphaeraceae archaeon]MDW0315981.1 rhomboid family intramembrane serine protease [Nitrososphaeraceae archaeon]MDW0332828.1 rhomboid family intramembrane serine protease [Nitrososphaeraceae archaeon]